MRKATTARPGEIVALQHKAAAKDRIVSAAKQLFAERGFHRTSMADLADFAQVSVGTLYRSFPSKSEIIRAIVLADTEETLTQLQAVIAQVRSGEVLGPDAMERLILAWVSKRGDALEHEVVAEVHRNPDIARMISEICGQFRDLFCILAKLLRPGLDEADAEGLAELLLACLFGMGNREFTHPRLSEDKTAAVVSRLILQGVLQEQSSSKTSG